VQPEFWGVLVVQPPCSHCAASACNLVRLLDTCALSKTSTTFYPIYNVIGYLAFVFEDLSEALMIPVFLPISLDRKLVAGAGFEPTTFGL